MVSLGTTENWRDKLRRLLLPTFAWRSRLRFPGNLTLNLLPVVEGLAGDLREIALFVPQNHPEGARLLKLADLLDPPLDDLQRMVVPAQRLVEWSCGRTLQATVLRVLDELAELVRPDAAPLADRADRRGEAPVNPPDASQKTHPDDEPPTAEPDEYEEWLRFGEAYRTWVDGLDANDPLRLKETTFRRRIRAGEHPFESFLKPRTTKKKGRREIQLSATALAEAIQKRTLIREAQKQKLADVERRIQPEVRRAYEET